MFRKHYEKRSSNILFVIFRLILSVVMFTLLLVGGYSAYKHFSGLDPLKLDPQAILKDAVKIKTPAQLTAFLSTIKLPQKADVNNQPVLEKQITTWRELDKGYWEITL